MDNTTGRRMNVLLKFSWGHILASLAVIATAYGTFVGLTYRLGGGYIVPGVITFVVSLVLVLSFSTLQRLKGTDSGFAACIRRERILFFSFPFILCVLMVPFMHSLTVHSREDAIRTRFEQSIQDSRKMFDSYEEYCFIVPEEGFDGYKICGEFWTCNEGPIDGPWSITIPAGILE